MIYKLRQNCYGFPINGFFLNLESIRGWKYSAFQAKVYVATVYPSMDGLSVIQYRKSADGLLRESNFNPTHCNLVIPKQGGQAKTDKVYQEQFVICKTNPLQPECTGLRSDICKGLGFLVFSAVEVLSLSLTLCERTTWDVTNPGNDHPKYL